MTLGGGFPDGSLASTSRSGSGVGVQSGSSTFLNSQTPPGAIFGSSRGAAYLNLRPAADDPASPSVTVYTFDRPTPSSGWAFVLGDIDADRVVLDGVDAQGRPVDAAGLGFAGVFNYCGGSPSPCPPTDPPDLPSWDAASRTLSGNPEALDTSGAAAWFRPTVPLRTLTVTFFQRSGLPLYQTWFASLARTVSGTVTGCPGGPGSPVAGVTVTLTDATGTVVATTTTAEDGSYRFEGFVAAGYQVSIRPPSECLAPADVQPVDISEADGQADFALVSEGPVEPTPTPSPTASPTPTPTDTPVPSESPTPTTAPTPSPAPTTAPTSDPSAPTTPPTVETAKGPAPTNDAASLPAPRTGHLADTGAPALPALGATALTAVATGSALLAASRRGRAKAARSDIPPS